MHINGEVGSAILDESAASISTVEGILLVEGARVVHGQSFHQIICSPELFAVDSELVASQALQCLSDSMRPNMITFGDEFDDGTLGVGGRRATMSNLAEEITCVASI